ncbi:MAG: hypothetical protein PHP06_05850 [Clostridia bacterium]|nr:hypothetical protein [Clostridia bacterium]
MAAPTQTQSTSTTIIQHIPTLTSQPVYTQVSTPERTVVEQIGFTPKLRPYDIDKSHDIWHAKDPSSYITPNDPWVQYYAITGASIQTIYKTDIEMYPDNPDKDVWQNAAYTLFTGFGDCEDLAIVEASVDIAKGRKAVVVAGYAVLPDGSRIRDYWEEIFVEGIKVIKPTNPLLEAEEGLVLEPKFMFSDKISWRRYDENWYI